ncbi:hypothetical protein KAF25_009884 [Fusarium avenaceum]|uniref:Uncharacterized protein n=1 Tax=Fusarium avenaceum TaxID=40199 RepID=A0A9P7KY06_9HYPO|nr:hypothetical protein KAF25_009884 [Fusarium avenaceum]
MKFLVVHYKPSPRCHHHYPSPEDRTTTPTQPSSSRSLSSLHDPGAVRRRVEALNGPDNQRPNPRAVGNPDPEQGLPPAGSGASPEMEDKPI